MKSIKKAILAAAMAGAFGFGATAQAAVTIDLFTDPADASHAVSDSTVGGGGSFQEYAGANIVGGARDIFVETLAKNFPSGSTTMAAGGGFLSYSQSSGVTGRGVVQWDGADGSEALDVDGLGGADLTACGAIACDRFVATVEQADFGFGYAITVVDMNGNSAVLTASTQFPVAAPTTAEYLLSWFNLADGDYFLGGLLFNIDHTGGVIDFSQIGALQFEINVPFGAIGEQADIDLTLSAITSTNVPEPGALALVGVGLLGAAAAGRRRKSIKG